MIVVHLEGGLGNQMFQYAIGRRLSLIHNVPLTLDISWYSRIPEGAALRTYDLNNLNIRANVTSHHELNRIREIQASTYWNRLISRIQSKLGVETYSVFREKTHGVYDPDILN